jgi:hypothetical protein
MRENGQVESFTTHEIGERDGWLCGICRDADNLVDPARRRPDPLSPSIDHITPVALGGTHTRRNVQIAHWFCNQEKNVHRDGCSATSSEFMRAKLAQQRHGTPVPEALWRARFSTRSARQEYMLALCIELGDVAAEPRSEPARSRLHRIAHARGIADEAIEDDLARLRASLARRKRRPGAGQELPGS